MKERLKSMIFSISGSPEHVSEERFFLTITSFSASLFLSVLCVLHFYLKLAPVPLYVALFSIVIMGLMYYLLRLKNKIFIPKLVLTIMGLVLNDVSFYYKYLSNGPVLHFFLIYIALIIWVWRGKYLWLFLGLYIVNLIFLAFLEFNAPESILFYSDMNILTFDIFVSMFFYSLLLSGLLFLFKSEFIRQKEKAILSDKLKSAFLANMSHEIRTPLNSIIGFSYLLNETEEKETRDRFFKIVEDSGTNLLRLIDEIINLSKIESGSVEIKKTNVFLKDLFEELEVYFNIELKKRERENLTIKFTLEDEDLYLKTDALRLKQIFTNLIVNSIKFTNQGGINCSCEKNKHYLLFKVSDTGIGIPKEDQEKVFERFVKFNYHNLNSDGTGIGLSIVQKLVNILGGEIWLESDTGVGTTFYFTLPVS